jgi:hypothetical protein
MAQSRVTVPQSQTTKTIVQFAVLFPHLGHLLGLRLASTDPGQPTMSMSERTCSAEGVSCPVVIPGGVLLLNRQSQGGWGGYSFAILALLRMSCGDG